MTKDIGITLGIDVGGLDGVVEVVRAIGLDIIPNEYKAFVERTSVLPTKDQKTGIRVDFIFSFTPYERQAIARAKALSFGKAVVMFASVEDVVIHKIFAGRPRDLEDVRSIILKNPNLEIDYVRGWLSEFQKSPEKAGLLNAFDDILGTIQG